MIQEEYRDSSHKQENAISAALKGGIIAGTVGAALAYQPWGRGISRFLGRVHGTVTETIKRNESILGGASSRHWTRTHYEEAYNNLKQSWADSTLNNVITIRKESQRSLTSLIDSVEKQKLRARSTAEALWRKDVLEKSAFEEIDKSHLGDNEKVQIKSVVEEISGDVMNSAKNAEIMRKHQLTDNALSFAKQVEQNLQRKHKATVEHDHSADDYSERIKKTAEALKQQIEERAYSLETLERFLGRTKGERKGVGNLDKMVHTGIRIMTGSRRLSWGEALTHLKSGHITDVVDIGRDSHTKLSFFMEQIGEKIRAKHGEAGYQRLQQLAVDPESTFVSSGGKVYSKFESGKFWKNFLTMTRNTLPGKLLKIGDLDNALRIPATQVMRITSHDPGLRDKLQNMGEGDKLHFRIGEDIYSLNVENNTSEYNETLNNGDLKFVSGRFGFFHKNIEAMRGMTKTKISDNPIFRMLDIAQDREEYSGSVISDFVSMFVGENKRKKKFSQMLHMSDEQFEKHSAAMTELRQYYVSPSAMWEDISDSTKEYTTEYMDNLRKVSQLFRQNTHTISSHAISELSNVAGLGGDTKHLLKLISEEDLDRVMSSLTDINNSRSRLMISGDEIAFLNKDLDKLVKGWQVNPDKALNKIELVSEESGISYGTDSINIFRAPMGNETYYFQDSLRREMAKEAILRIGFDYTKEGVKTVDYNAINRAIAGLNLSEHDRDELEKLSQYAIFQDYTRLNAMGKLDDYYMGKALIIGRADELFRGKPGGRLSKDVLDIFRDVYTTTVEREVSILEGNLEPDIATLDKLEDVVAINRSVNPLELAWHAQQAINDPLDILKSINEGTIRLSGDATNLEKDIDNIWKGLTANREDMSGANLYTFIPFWFTKRLSDELNKVGLGFSAETTTSAGNFAMSFITKRALPIFAGITYLDWADDTTRELVGHGLWEGFTAGVANVDLGIRRGISALGIDDWLKETKALNPIWQYWGDHDEYQSYEERLDYYQNGYTPVRKAAWSEVGHAA